MRPRLATAVDNKPSLAPHVVSAQITGERSETFDLKVVNAIDQRHKIDDAVNTDDLLGEVAVNKRMWRPPASLLGSAKAIWITCASSTQSHTEVKAHV